MDDGLIERLNINLPDGPEAASRIAELEAENARLRGGDRIGTHSPDCWSFGPKHYECATRRVAELEAKLAERDTEVADLTKALTGLTCGGSEFFTRKGDRYIADIKACVDYNRRRTTDAFEGRVKAIREKNRAEAKLATAVGALEEADQRLSRPDWTVQRDKTRMSIRSSLASIQERT